MRIFNCFRALVAGLVATTAAACVVTGPRSDLFGEGFHEEGPPLADLEGAADGFGAPAYAPLPEGADLDRPLEVLFAPDDPVVSLELEMIRRVVAARAADPRSFGEDEGPYRIRYAVYNLRNPDVAAALADAADAGVDVQVLIDDDQLDPARDWNVMDEYLVEERGFEYAPDHRALGPEGRRTADLVGITGSGLMHLKLRLFETPEWSAALSGSMNPGDSAFMNDETLHLVRDPIVVARYAAAYEAVLAGTGLHNEWDPAAAVNVLFTPEASGPRAGTRLLEWIAEEQELILLMVFSLRDITAPGFSGSLVELLARKAREGVPVYVITDRKQSDGVDAEGNRVMRDDPTEDRLRAAGVHVYEATNRATPFTAMHHKVGVLGLTRVRVITDASNWTAAGLGSARQRASNVESVLFIDSERLDGGRTGDRYLAQFLRTLWRYAPQNPDEPGHAEVLSRFASMAGWPSLELAFRATARTEWGETVQVRGDRPELGSWGFEHAGVPLGTDETSYPVWRSLEPVALPLGAAFEWKLVVAGSGSVRWEAGQNRLGHVAPPALLPLSGPELAAYWQH